MISLLHTKSPQLLSPLLRYFCDLRTHLPFLLCTPVITTRPLSSTISNQKQLKETSFTVSYLINSCGLSPEAANSATKRVKNVTLETADSVLALLEKHGLSSSQITKSVKLEPRILLCDSEKTIFPKLKFFSSVGITGPNLTRFISSNPSVLRYSLRNRIIPVHKFLKSALLFDDDMVIKAIIKQSRIFGQDIEKISAPNLLFLRQIGMPQSLIKQIFIHRPSLLCHKADKFRHMIKELIGMGFCPTEMTFIHALHAVVNYSESSWQHKIEVYRRCGWSKDEILSAFKKCPQCMTPSEKKIIGIMDFLVNVMDMKPSEIAAYPYFFTYSLKQRIIPRGLVFKFLKSKGALEKHINFYSVVILPQKCFLERYMDKHREHIPYLQDVFEGRMSPQKLGFQPKNVLGL